MLNAHVFYPTSNHPIPPIIPCMFPLRHWALPPPPPSSFLLAVTAPTKPPRPFRERHTPEMRTDTQGAACVRPTLFFLLLFMAAEPTSYMPTHSPRYANDFGPQQTNQARSTKNWALLEIFSLGLDAKLYKYNKTFKKGNKKKAISPSKYHKIHTVFCIHLHYSKCSATKHDFWLKMFLSFNGFGGLGGKSFFCWRLFYAHPVRRSKWGSLHKTSKNTYSCGGVFERKPATSKDRRKNSDISRRDLPPTT